MLNNESPLLAEIMNAIIPMDFRLLDLKFSEKNLLMHIECFNDMIRVQSLTKSQSCRAFP